MRAVNLLPSDLRGAATKPAPSARQEKAQGFGAYVVLGVLALCVAAFAGYVLTTNTVKQREADLQAAQDRATAAAAKASALKPYADFEAMASSRIETVRGLAAARFDWERALRDLARAVPGDVKLTALNGDMGLPGAQGSGGDPLRGSIQAPAITLTGCAPSQVAVARMMARLKAVDGVTRVSLSKTEKPSASGSTGTESPCGEGEPPSFSVIIFFERSAAAAALDATGTDAAATVPVPSVVNESAPADGEAATDDTGAAGTDGTQPQAGTDSTGTSTTTTTTTGGTP